MHLSPIKSLLATSALAFLVVAPLSAQAQVIKVDGSSTVYPITEGIAEDFQKANKGLKVTVGVSGTGGGFKKFCRDETDVLRNIEEAAVPSVAPETQAVAISANVHPSVIVVIHQRQAVHRSSAQRKIDGWLATTKG